LGIGRLRESPVQALRSAAAALAFAAARPAAHGPNDDALGSAPSRDSDGDAIAIETEDFGAAVGEWNPDPFDAAVTAADGRHCGSM
jgi:hypothetical protein